MLTSIGRWRIALPVFVVGVSILAIGYLRTPYWLSYHRPEFSYAKLRGIIGMTDRQMITRLGYPIRIRSTNYAFSLESPLESKNAQFERDGLGYSVINVCDLGYTKYFRGTPLDVVLKECRKTYGNRAGSIEQWVYAFPYRRDHGVGILAFVYCLDGEVTEFSLVVKRDFWWEFTSRIPKWLTNLP